MTRPNITPWPSFAPKAFQPTEAQKQAIAAVPALLEALEHAFERINSAINSGHCMKYANAVTGHAGACIEDYDKIRDALIAAGYQF